jgi:ribonuclease M5
VEKPVIPYPIAVEGKYDKIKITSLFEARVFVTDGFGVFRREDKVAFFRKLTEKAPLIVLTDSDGAGTVIRNYFNSILPKEKLIHIYTPAIKGKERRKTAPSKAGNLGVEGIDAVILRDLLAPYVQNGEGTEAPAAVPRGSITKADLYAVGLSGRPESAVKRREFALSIGFPEDISATALLAALELLYTKEEFFELMGR